MASIDFGTRLCKVCLQPIPAEIFGSHVIEQHDVIAQWPGGLRGWFADLEASLEESIRRAKGRPEEEQLRGSLEAVRRWFSR